MLPTGIVRLINLIFRPLFAPWIAGNTPKEVLAYAKKINAQGGKATLHFLGEKQNDIGTVQATVSEYLNLLTGIRLARVNADIAMKPSQLGLALEENGAALCEQNMQRIVRAAREKGIFCWMDMESFRYVKDTIEIYRRLLRDFDNIGICLLANVKRSEQDLRELAGESKNKPVVRLAKGVYAVTAPEGYTRKEEVEQALGRMILFAFENKRVGVALATHDERLMALAESYGEKYDKRFEIQMLKGVREALQQKLLREGMMLNIYAPYGKNVFMYGVRRAREAKQGTYPKLIALLFGWLYDWANRN